jgi:hypothetical protein
MLGWKIFGGRGHERTDSKSAVQKPCMHIIGDRPPAGRGL